jgi:hypothetical protein
MQNEIFLNFWKIIFLDADQLIKKKKICFQYHFQFIDFFILSQVPT